MPSIQVIAHRGASAHEPENTLRGIRRAIEEGADMVEVDVRFVDGEIIVFHDDTLGRTTNGQGSLYARTFRELRALDAGMGERIPTLGEVLELIDHRLPLNIEFKDAASVRSVCALIESRAPEETLLSGFDWGTLRETRRLLSNGRIGVLTEHATAACLREAQELDATSLHIDLRNLTLEFVLDAHALNLPVYTFTVRTAADIAKMKACGADGCFADDPAWVCGSLD